MRGACFAMGRSATALRYAFPSIVGWRGGSQIRRPERLIEPRIYRAAFVPAVLAVVLVMFSFEGQPRPLPQGLAADVLFDGRQAAGAARQIVAQARDRRAGTAGDLAVAAR